MKEVKAPALDPQTVQLYTPWWSRFATSGALNAYRRRKEAKEHEKQAKLLKRRIAESFKVRRKLEKLEQSRLRLRLFGDAAGRARLLERVREFFEGEDQPDTFAASFSTWDQLAAYGDDYRSLLDPEARNCAAELLSTLEATLTAGPDDKTVPGGLTYYLGNGVQFQLSDASEEMPSAFDHAQSWAAAIFVVSLADYDSPSGDKGEDPPRPRLRRFLDDFDAVCNDSRLRDTPLVLLLSDRDQFETRTCDHGDDAARGWALERIDKVLRQLPVEMPSSQDELKLDPLDRPAGLDPIDPQLDQLELVKLHFRQRHHEAVARGMRDYDDLVVHANFRPDDTCSVSFVPIWKAVQHFVLEQYLKSKGGGLL